MTPRVVSGLFLAAVLLLIGLFDLTVYLRFGETATISTALRHIAADWAPFPYLVAFAMGCLFGHLFL